MFSAQGAGEISAFLGNTKVVGVEKMSGKNM